MPAIELRARYNLLNLSVYDLVEEFARHVSLCFALLTRLFLLANANVVSLISLSDLYKAGISLVIDTLTVTPIKNNNNLLNTINSHIKLRKLKEKRKARLDSLLDSNNYYLDSSLDINSKDNLENEEATIAKNLAREQKKRLKALLNAKYNKGQSLCKSRDSNRILHSRRLTGAYILYFKELLSNNSRIFASVIGITRTQAIVLLAIIEHVHFKN
ncbi:hypothetical protein HBH99_090180 [Parastagonospora nodorum]|nr:hypothetical protein HBH99_090180 [Parastagonospora nodorum]